VRTEQLAAIERVPGGLSRDEREGEEFLDLVRELAFRYNPRHFESPPFAGRPREESSRNFLVTPVHYPRLTPDLQRQVAAVEAKGLKPCTSPFVTMPHELEPFLDVDLENLQSKVLIHWQRRLRYPAQGIVGVQKYQRPSARGLEPNLRIPEMKSGYPARWEDQWSVDKAVNDFFALALALPGSSFGQSFPAMSEEQGRESIQAMRRQGRQAGVELDSLALKQGCNRVVSLAVVNKLMERGLIDQEQLPDFFATATTWAVWLTRDEVLAAGLAPQARLRAYLPFPLGIGKKNLPHLWALPEIGLAIARYISSLWELVEEGKEFPLGSILGTSTRLLKMAKRAVDHNLGQGLSSGPSPKEIFDYLEKGIIPEIERWLSFYRTNPGLLNRRTSRPSLGRIPTLEGRRELIRRYGGRVTRHTNVLDF
jgi:hypothetical protein